MRLLDPVTSIDRVGSKTAEYMHKLNIHTVSDLLRYYPREYSVYKPVTPICEMQDGYYCAVHGIVRGRVDLIRKGKTTVLKASLADGTGSVELIWFNMPYLKNQLRSGNHIVVWGKARVKGNSFVLEQPEIYAPEVYEKKKQTMQPVYSLTFGLKNQVIVRALMNCFADADLMNQLDRSDIIPEASKNFPGSLSEALHNLHFPKNHAELQACRRRFVYEEFLIFLLVFRFRNGKKEARPSDIHIENDTYRNRLESTLPFQLTDSQVQVLFEIEKDMKQDIVMNRLIQGDVGSGKTVVAVLALLMVIENGYQGALMAPTEVLAVQHYHSITRMLKQAGLDIPVVLLTGALSVKQKREVRNRIASGEAKLIIGTHALIQEKVDYHDLGLVITDEQHRFGVKQREYFAQKGHLPHVLVMSATPIPRTLALILYGDMDVSVMKQPPLHRLPIKSCAVNTGQRNTSYKFMMDQIKEGHQCYVICPLVEESENLDGEDVVNYAAKLRGVFPSSVNIAYLHGKMTNDQKNSIMEKFQKNEIQILVSTTVIEVGVDVPNATVILIENAERFGLSALHQLRGRVGRGKDQSYCILISAMETETAKQRLQTLVKSTDGFFIAQEDLKQRGPGEFLGNRQSGEFSFKIGDIYADADLLQQADLDADHILDEDPELKAPAHEALRLAILEDPSVQIVL